MSDETPTSEAAEERDSSVALEFRVAVELRRRRGPIHDVWEARLTSVAIGAVTAMVLIYALVQVFTILEHLFGS